MPALPWSSFPALALALLACGCAAAPARRNLAAARTLRAHLAAGELEAARALLADDPRRWFDQERGAGAPWSLEPGSGPWAAWDDHFRKRTEQVAWEADARSATLTFRETNDYFELLERGWVRNQAVYLFDEDGRIRGLVLRGVGERPPGRTEEFLAWAREHAPAELAHLRPGGDIDPGGDRPARHRALLERWRRDAGLPAID